MKPPNLALRGDTLPEKLTASELAPENRPFNAPFLRKVPFFQSIHFQVRKYENVSFREKLNELRKYTPVN